MPNYRAPLTAPIVSLLIASFIVQPTVGWTESAQQAAERARAIREMRLGRGKEHLASGKKALSDKDYETAFGHYRAAVDDIPDAPATRGAREDAVDGLTKAGNKLAEQRVTEGYYVSAIQVLQEVLRFNPNDKRTLKMAANIEAPDYFEKQITPGHRANVEQVKQLFIEAQGYKNIGRFDMAQRKAEEIIGKDPHNVAARKLIEELTGKTCIRRTSRATMPPVPRRCMSWSRPGNGLIAGSTGWCGWWIPQASDCESTRRESTRS